MYQIRLELLKFIFKPGSRPKLFYVSPFDILYSHLVHFKVSFSVTGKGSSPCAITVCTILVAIVVLLTNRPPNIVGVTDKSISPNNVNTRILVLKVNFEFSWIVNADQ